MPGPNPHLKHLRQRIAKMPPSPGVYRWLDERGETLYVGKAKNLRNRLKSYVQKDSAPLGPWKQALIARVADLDVTVTGTELEALMLETNLIKEKKPKYNVLMKDDKNYVYVRISRDPFPRIDTVRQIVEDGSKHFGPFTSAFEIRETLTFLRRIFPYRTCRMQIEPPKGDHLRLPLAVTCKLKDRPTPCLDYHVKQCSAPCIGAILPEDYASSIRAVADFLKGNTAEAERILTEAMERAAREKKFEHAARLRDALQSLGRMLERQRITEPNGTEADVFGVALAGNRAHVVLLVKRSGKIIGEESFALSGAADDISEILGQFLPQYYGAALDIPEMIICASPPEGRETLEAWLRQERGKKVEIRVPERGGALAILKLAEANARQKIAQFETKWEAAERNTAAALEELKSSLGLPAVPKRIEGYDISHLSGTETVGSMSVIAQGKAAHDLYRSFTIRTMKEGEIDDTRAIREVLRRRLKHLAGGLKDEEQRLKDLGITLGRTRKADHAVIEKMSQRLKRPPLPKETWTRDSWIVARKGEDIIGFVRLLPLAKAKELQDLWVQDGEHAELPRVLVRRILATEKKKVYALCDPPLLELLADLTFREVRTGPKEIIDRLKKYHVICVSLPADRRVDPSLASRPDLLLIDGGKGQLNAALESLSEAKESIPVIALAKREEELYLPGRFDPLILPKDSPGRFLLMRLRDEAHRFANRHRETRLKKRSVSSALDQIPGIGPMTRTALLKKFGSVERVREAGDAELLEVLTEGQLKEVKKYLRKNEE